MANNDSDILGSTVGLSVSVGGTGEFPQPPHNDALADLRAQAEQVALTQMIEQGRRDLTSAGFATDFGALAAQKLSEMQQPTPLPAPPLAALPVPPASLPSPAIAALYNQETALTPYSGPAGSQYSAYDPRYGPAPSASALPEEMGLVPVASDYRRGYSGQEQASRGYGSPGGAGGSSYGSPGGSGGSGGAAAPSSRRTSYDDQRRYNDRSWRESQQEQEDRWRETFTDPPPREAALSEDTIEGSGGRNRGQEMHEEFRANLTHSDEEIYGAGMGGRFNKGFDRFKSSSVGKWLGSTESAWSLGFGGMQTISNLTRAIDPIVSGESYLPDQVGEQSLTSGLPLVGSILGAVGGARLGPGGSMGGQFLGQSLGAGAEDMADKYFTGHIFAQERAGQAIGSGQGGADAVKEITEALRSSLTPAAKELAETLTHLSRSAPVSASAPGEFGKFQFAMGTAFSENATGEERFLSSNPFMAPIRNVFNSNPFSGLSSQDYLGGAAAAAMAGDYAGVKSNFGFAEAEGERDTLNPKWKADSDFVKSREGESIWQKGVEDVFQPTRVRAYNLARKRLGIIPHQTGEVNAMGQHGTSTEPMEEKYLPGTEARRETISTQETDIKQMLLTHTLDEANIGYAGSLLSGDSAVLGGVMARGGGSAQIGTALTGMRRDARIGISALDRDIADNAKNAEKYPLWKPVFMANSAADREQEAKIRTGLDETAKSAFVAGLGEETGRFGLFELRDTLRGGTAKEMLPGYMKQVDYLNRVANDTSNPLSPGERISVEETALKTRYQAYQSVYGEENLTLDITRAGRNANITREAYLGTPQDAYNAGIRGIQSDRDQIAQNNSELTRGNLTNAQKLQLQKQNVELQGEIEVAPEKARQSLYGAQSALLTGDQTGHRAGLSDDLKVYGNAAFAKHNAFEDDDKRIQNDYADWQSAPTGTVQKSQAYGRYKTRLEAKDQEQDSAYLSRETQAERVEDSRISHEYKRALISPYMEGSPDSDPVTRGNAQIGNLRTRLGQAQRDLLNTPRSSPSYEANSERVEGYKDSIAGIEHDQMFAIERLLPEWIGGAGGRGTLSGVLPTKGQSAWGRNSPYITGSWGAPDRERLGWNDGHSPTPGGAAGGFLMLRGGAGGGAPSGGDAQAHGMLGPGTGNGPVHAPQAIPGMSGSEGASAIVAAVREVRDLLQRGLAPGGRSPSTNTRKPDLAFNAYNQRPGDSGRWNDLR